MSAGDGPARRRGLGRGLNALFGDGDGEADPSAVAADMAPRGGKTVPIEFLRPNPGQPRRRFDEAAIDALVASIRDKGVLQPILVRRHPDDANMYEIVAGERRWRAAQRAQLHEIPVVIKDLDEADAFEIALIENVAREDLTPLEEAEGYKRLVEQYGHTQETVARAVGRSRSHVANMVRLLSLPDGVKAMLDDGRLSAGQARPLIGHARADALAEEIVAKGLTARQAEKRVQSDKAPARRGAPAPGAMDRLGQAVEKDADTKAVERDLEARLGLPVSLAMKGEAGTLSVRFNDLDQLDELIALLSAGGPRPRASNDR